MEGERKEGKEGRMEVGREEGMKWMKEGGVREGEKDVDPVVNKTVRPLQSYFVQYDPTHLTT